MLTKRQHPYTRDYNPMNDQEREDKIQRGIDLQKKKKIEQKIDTMKREIHHLEEEHTDSDFAEKVEKENESRKRLFGTGTHACKNCSRAFVTKWELNQHLKKCRPDASQYLHLKLGDQYPCNICHK